MIWSKNLLADPERFLVERFGFGVLAHGVVQRGQVIEAIRHVGMFRPKDFLPDPERFLVERFGFGVLAHVLVQLARLLRLLAVRDVLAQEPSAGSGALPGRAVRLWRIAHIMVQRGQVIEARRRVGMFWPKNFLADL